MKSSYILLGLLWGQALWAQNYSAKQIALLQNTAVQHVTVEGEAKWLCTDKGLLRLEQDNLTSVLLQADSLRHRGVSTLLIDHLGNKWIGNYQSQVFQIDSLNNKQLVDFQEFGQFLITSLALDQEGKLWASTFGGGVFTYDKIGGKSRYQAENSKLLDNQVFRILVDKQNRKWIGTAEGLCSTDGQKWKTYDLEGQITDIVQYQNDLWVATATLKGAELWRYENFGRWERFPLPPEIASMRLMDLSFDFQGNLWIVADIVACWKNGKWFFLSDSEGFTSHSGLCIAPDAFGKIWVGTEGKGLFTIEIPMPRPIIKSIDELLGLKIPDEALRQPIPLRLQFERGSAEISIFSKDELDKISLILSQNPDIEAEIAGHTDNIGDPKANQELSEKRAAAVKQYLFVKNRIAQERIRAVGYGGTRPVASNRQESTRQLNRRVEIILERRK